MERNALAPLVAVNCPIAHAPQTNPVQPVKLLRSRRNSISQKAIVLCLAALVLVLGHIAQSKKSQDAMVTGRAQFIPDDLSVFGSISTGGLSCAETAKGSRCRQCVHLRFKNRCPRRLVTPRYYASWSETEGDLRMAACGR
jgi:hypothetical protein